MSPRTRVVEFVVVDTVVGKDVVAVVVDFAVVGKVVVVVLDAVVVGNVNMVVVSSGDVVVVSFDIGIVHT